VNFKEAIVAHAKWKITLSNYLKSPDGSLKPDVVGLDSRCALGQWIYGEAIGRCAGNPDYEKLRADHAKFHQAAAAVIREIEVLAHKTENELLGESSAYGQASSLVISTLEQFGREHVDQALATTQMPDGELPIICWKLETQLSAMDPTFVPDPTARGSLAYLDGIATKLAESVDTSQKFMKQFLDNAVGGIFSVNRRGFINNEYSRVTEEFLLDRPAGKQFASLFGREDQSRLDALVSRIFSGASNFSTIAAELPRELFLNLFNLEFSYRPIYDQTGALTDFLVVMKDVTRLNKMQEASEREVAQAEEETRRERARSFNNAKLASLGEMSAGVAHEINNPLAIISGTIGLIPRFVGDPTKLEAKLEAMKKASERIGKIVSGLKKFSRSDDGGKHEVHPVRRVAGEAVGFTDTKSNRSATPVQFQCDSDATIRCDEVAIGQVIINLVNNAIDAVENLPEKWVKVTVTDDGPSVVLRVSDSGGGIPPEVAEKMFQPFFTTKRLGEGTGLGLSISKGILTEHHATIEVVPNVPNTCFEIRFRRVEEKSHAA